MSRHYFQLILMAVLVCGVSACANKGKLKSPSQITYDDAKKAKKAQKKSDEDSSTEAPAEPAPADTAPAVGAAVPTTSQQVPQDDIGAEPK